MTSLHGQSARLYHGTELNCTAGSFKYSLSSFTAHQAQIHDPYHLLVLHKIHHIPVSQSAYPQKYSATVGRVPGKYTLPHEFVGNLLLDYVAYVLPLRLMLPYLWATLDGSAWPDGSSHWL